MTCIFCSIANKDIPAYKVYENDHILAFLDISQGTKGHTLIIPKKHYDHVYQLTEEVAKELFSIVPKLSNAIKKAFNPIGLNIISNNQKPYQSVNHFHIHLLPRYENDELLISMVNHQNDYTKPAYEEVQNAIKNAL